ncbi:hypothetical protein ACFL3A_04490 [Pseudomonadota bacterium]
MPHLHAPSDADTGAVSMWASSQTPDALVAPDATRIGMTFKEKRRVVGSVVQ